jgi:hypothetical protein
MCICQHAQSIFGKIAIIIFIFSARVLITGLLARKISFLAVFKLVFFGSRGQAQTPITDKTIT